MTRLDQAPRIEADFQLGRALPGPYGFVKLRLGGASVGLVDEETFLLPLVQVLEGLARQGAADADSAALLSQPDTSKVWQRMLASGQSHSLPSIEFFDKVRIFAVSDDRNVRILWQSREHLEPLPHDVVISLNEVQATAEKLRRIYDDVRNLGRPDADAQ